MINSEIIFTLFENMAATFPRNTAISDASRTVTYSELYAAAGRIAHDLTCSGLCQEDIVGIYLEASVDYVAAVLGVLQAGALFLPLGTQFPEKRLQAITNKANPKLIITNSALEKEFTGKVQDYPGKMIIIGNDVTVEDKERADAVKAAVSPEDGCYVITTSGSTGEPKLILGSHRGLSHFLRWEIYKFGIDHNARVSLLAPPTFDVSLRDIFIPLCTGGTLCIPGEEARHNPNRLLVWLQAERVSLVHIVPSIFRLLTRVIKESGKDNHSLPELRRVLIAGEPLYGSDVNSWRQVMGERIKLINLYGPSETTLAKMFYEIEDKQFLSQEIIPLGKPIPDTEIVIIRDNRICRADETGEIHIKTPFMTKGYLSSPQLNRMSFVPNPVGNGIVYKTGDRGRYLPDGNVCFEGRLDGQVKLYGNRVEIGEIEVILRQHPKVSDAVVNARPDVFGNPRLIGYIIPAKGQKPAVDSLRRFVAEYLPDYMIPAVFVTLNAFPLTHSGKVDRNALPDPGNVRPEMEQAYLPPASGLEKDLTAIWCQVLNLEQVGSRDNFFDLGGTSLLAVTLVTQIQASLGIELPVIKLFEFPNISSLAQYMVGNQGEQTSLKNSRERARRREAALERRKQVRLRSSR